MRIYGEMMETDGETILFHLDEKVDVMELRRINDGEGRYRAEIVFDDNRIISSLQRKKAWALMGDISRWTGYSMLEVAEQMKIRFCIEQNMEWLSLSNCSVTDARNFITFLIDFCFEWNIPFKEKGLDLHDDIRAYLWLCIKHRKCAICGLKADIHHVDTVGMGRDRRKVRHDELRMIALCRKHHSESHNIGQSTFDEKYMVQGIKLNDDDIKKFKI